MSLTMLELWHVFENKVLIRKSISQPQPGAGCLNTETKINGLQLLGTRPTLPFTHWILWVEEWGAVVCVAFQDLRLPRQEGRGFDFRVLGGVGGCCTIWLRTCWFSPPSVHTFFVNTSLRPYGREAACMVWSEPMTLSQVHLSSCPS
jgi:hypothetical protein